MKPDTAQLQRFLGKPGIGRWIFADGTVYEQPLELLGIAERPDAIRTHTVDELKRNAGGNARTLGIHPLDEFFINESGFRITNPTANWLSVEFEITPQPINWQEVQQSENPQGPVLLESSLAHDGGTHREPTQGYYHR